MRKTKLIVVSHTHWDREWYEPFQLFRMRLVRLLDRLLDILASDPQYRHFTLDGQTVVLEDYLEVRPEKEKEVREHVRRGRLLIGPWYVLPDEFLVSGEALIRNLMLGHRMASHFGPVMPVGYVPDPFGHISQLPQILRGFGIDQAVFRRGLGEEKTELCWEASDGTSVFVSYLRDGYANACRLPLEPGALLQRISEIRSSLEPFATTDYLLLLNGDDHAEPQAGLPVALEAANRELPDAELIHGTLPMYLTAVRKANPQVSIVRGELRCPKRHHLVPGVLSTRMWIKQRNAWCEALLEKWAEPMAAIAERMTRSVDGPMGEDTEAITPPLFPSSTHSLIWQAWKYLLQNQPHDSICGCSVDQVHREMATRYDWSEQIAEELAQQSLQTISQAIDTASLTSKDPGLAPRSSLLPIIVFNPVSGPRTDWVEAIVDLPGSLESFEVVDRDGRTVPFQILGTRQEELASFDFDQEGLRRALSMVVEGRALGMVVKEVYFQEEGGCLRVDITLAEHGEPDLGLVADSMKRLQQTLEAGRAQLFRLRVHKALEVKLGLVVNDVPGYGYKTFAIVPGKEGPRVSDVEGLLSSQVHLENEFYRVAVDAADGTLVVTDKETGMVFPGLNRFVDGADAGDEYNYCPPARDQLVERPASAPEISLVSPGPARATLRIGQIYRLPAGLGEGREARSPETVEVPIVSYVSLYSGVKRIDIRTEVDNGAQDHRLRAIFPTPIVTDCSHAAGVFDILRRPLDMPHDTAAWIEQPVPTHPQKEFVDVSDGVVGFTLANRGLPEYEVIRGETGVTVALTLLRCVGVLSDSDLPCRQGAAGPLLATPEAQCPGKHVFEYSMMPHASSWDQARRGASFFNYPMRAVPAARRTGVWPIEASFIELEPRCLEVSAIKRAERGDALIVRFWNTSEEPQEVTLRSPLPIRSAYLADMAEDPQAPLTIAGNGAIHLPVRGRQIITTRLE
ncbi:MAG: glycoside hydrolase family 38 C-terminal domain-containing protein [Chloroflexota bacterium]